VIHAKTVKSWLEKPKMERICSCVGSYGLWSDSLNNNQWFSKVAVWLVIALVLFVTFKQFEGRAATSDAVGYSEFLDQVRDHKIKQVTIVEGQGGSEIVAQTQDDKKIRTNATYLDRGLVGDLIANGVKFDVKAREEPSLLVAMLLNWGPVLLLMGLFVYFMRQMQGGGKGGAFSFGKSKARLLDENTNTVTFAERPTALSKAGWSHSARLATCWPSRHR
jgi:cell division protease FtsH